MARPEMIPFYKSTAWQVTRRIALTRDGYTCQKCGARATEVHHLVEINPQNVQRLGLDVDNLQSLCHACHRQITMLEHGRGGTACDVGFQFDCDGNLVPIMPGEYRADLPPG